LAAGFSVKRVEYIRTAIHNFAIYGSVFL